MNISLISLEDIMEMSPDDRNELYGEEDLPDVVKMKIMIVNQHNHITILQKTIGDMEISNSFKSTNRRH